ncbi:MAG: hypothetical protein ACTH9H_09925, partial [Galactobacter sp.]
MTEETVAVDFAALMDPEDTQSTEVPGSKLEAEIAEVAGADVAAARPRDAAFTFRSLLTQKQREDLEKGAPKLAQKFVADVN